MGRVCAAFDHFPKVAIICSHQLYPLCKRRRGLDIYPRHFLIADHADLFLFRLRPYRFGPINKNCEIGPPT